MTKKTQDAIKAFNRVQSAETALASAQRILEGYIIGLGMAEIQEYQTVTQMTLDERAKFGEMMGTFTRRQHEL